MEDLDIRIFNLGSKLAIDPRSDSNNPDYVSYLPPKNSNVSPVSSPHPQELSVSSTAQRQPTAQNQSPSPRIPYTKPFTSSPKTLQVPRKRTVSSSSANSINRSVSPVISGSSLKQGLNNHSEKTKAPRSTTRSPNSASRNTGSFSKFLKSTSAAATANASIRSSLTSSILSRTPHSSEDFRDAHDNELANTTPIKSASKSSKVFLNPNNRRKPSISPKPLLSQNSVSEHSKSSQPVSKPSQPPSKSSTKSSIFRMTSKQRNPSSSNSSPHLQPVTRTSSPKDSPSNTTRDISRDRSSPALTTKKNDTLKHRDGPISRGKASVSLKDLKEMKEKEPREPKVKEREVKRDQKAKEVSTPTHNSPFTLPPLLSPTLPDWCDDIPKKYSLKAPDSYEDEEKPKPKPELNTPTINYSNSLVSPPSDDSSESKPRRNSLIVSLKLRTKDRKKADTLTNSKLNTLEPIKKKTVSSLNKRQLSDGTVENGTSGPKKMRVSRDYSDSESEEETVIKKAPIKKPKSNASTREFQEQLSSSPGDLAVMSTPKPDSPANFARNATESGASSSSGERDTNGSDVRHLGRLESPAVSLQASRPTNASTSYTPEQRTSSSQVLTAKSTHWRNLAHDQKRKAESLRKAGSGNTNSGAISRKKSIAYGMDSVLGYLIAFEYHDRADQIVRRSRQTGHWNSLVKYIDWLIGLIQNAGEQSQSSNSKNKNDGELYRNLIGLCYQLRAMVYMRISQCYHELMLRVMNSGTNAPLNAVSPESVGSNGSSWLAASSNGGSNNNVLSRGRQDSVSESDDSTNRLRDLTTITSKYFKSQTDAITEFKKGFKELPVENVRLDFPKTWAARDDPNNNINNTTTRRTNSRGFRPMDDAYMLPLHVYSTLQEATAFACHILREWCTLYGIEYDSILSDR